MKYIIIAVGLLYGFWIGVQKEVTKITGEETVQEVLDALGDAPSPNLPNKLLPGASAEIGESLVKFGKSQNLSGGNTMRQSRHFVCTSCHNVERESAYLNIEDPEERLAFTHEKGLPFVQGSPLFGIVNRTKFYNGDYEKKYGDLVDKARNNIREAIQLCAVECSQGRALKDWEIESILMYMWTIGLTMNDLQWTEQELDLVDNALSDGKDRAAAISVIKSKYLDHAPATFGTPPSNYKEGMPDIEGNPVNGKIIYEDGCLHCHAKNEYSHYRLDNESLTFKQLANRMKYYDERSMYHVSRYGTKPKFGKRAYMPQYTEEKMSDQQLEDLRAYVLEQADK